MTATEISPRPALQLDGVTVELAGRRLLDDITLDIGPGSIVAIVGANGAGKTTLLDAITGAVPASGMIIGTPARPAVARVHQGSPLPDTLTVGELALVVARGSARADTLLTAFGLQRYEHRRIAELSTGMRRILDLAVTTIDDPTLLLLDEPASGLAEAEIDHLAELLIDYRARTDATIVLVEHNRALVARVADRTVTIDRGRLVEDAPIAPAPLAPVVGEPLRHRLGEILNAGREAAPPPSHELSTWTKLRFGLREFASGMASVLILGVLNRVMKVELGISLALVATLLASYNLAAPVAMALGHRSDRTSLWGRHRTPYIVGGAVVMALAVAASPHVADRLAQGLSVGSILVALALFATMGVGMYTSGTVYFALLADMTPPRERGHATSIVYLMLMLGIITGAALSVLLLGEDATGRYTLFAIVAVLVVALTTTAVWNLDKGELDDNDVPDATVRQAIADVARLRTARRFFAFTTIASTFLFLQQAVLEPFGGDVLGLSARATAGFNAVQTIGVVVAMFVTGRAVADRHGHRRTALLGLIGSAAAFTALGLAALSGSAPASWFAILGVGLATGLFSVAVLALMMAMTDPYRVALFMGAWTVAHALADGIATAGGGLVYQVALHLLGDERVAYAAVFGLQAVGLSLCIPLLLRIDVTTFAKELATESARRAAGMLGWIGHPHKGQ